VAERHFIFGATIDELENALRQAAPRDLTQISDVVRDAHQLVIQRERWQP
jgi:hypothetical protein